MSTALDIMHNIVPISEFSRGGAARAFEKVCGRIPVIVVKHNVPTAVITSPEEYARLTEAEENLALLTEALSRMERNEGKRRWSMDEVLAEFGITDEDLDALPDEELE